MPRPSAFVWHAGPGGKSLACVDFLGDADPPATAIREALSAKRLDAWDLTRVVPYRLIAPFFASVLHRFRTIKGTASSAASQTRTLKRPFRSTVLSTETTIECTRMAEYIMANFPILSDWAERHWVAFFNRATLWRPTSGTRSVLLPPRRPPAPLSAHELSEAGEDRAPRFFPPTTVEALDLATAQAAVDALSKRGFDRVRAYREVRRAYEYLEGLGYSGPKEEAEAHLQELIDRHWEIGASTSTAPNLEPSLEWKDGSDFEEPGDAVPSVRGWDVRDRSGGKRGSLRASSHRRRFAEMGRHKRAALQRFQQQRIFAEWTIAEALARRADSWPRLFG